MRRDPSWVCTNPITEGNARVTKFQCMRGRVACEGFTVLSLSSSPSFLLLWTISFLGHPEGRGGGVFRRRLKREER